MVIHTGGQDTSKTCHNLEDQPGEAVESDDAGSDEDHADAVAVQNHALVPTRVAVREQHAGNVSDFRAKR